MEVEGRDTGRAAYRVSVMEGDRRIAGFVPEALMGGGRLLGGPRHQPAYEWLARHRHDIEAALRAKVGGRPVAAPFDLVELAEETGNAD